MAVDIDALRRLVRDPDSNVFEDDDLIAAIDAAGDSILRAAGIAFKTLAAEYVLIGKSVKTDDLAINTLSRGKDLLEVASSFFADARETDSRSSDSFFAVVPLPLRASTLAAM